MVKAIKWKRLKGTRGNTEVLFNASLRVKFK